MNNLKFAAIIPARYASTRFPGKPLVKIGGVMMIERVWRRVHEVVEDVFVATDDKRIYDAVIDFGGKAVMTSENHKSGTDRCREAYLKVCPDANVIINVQGDEPFVAKSQIQSVMECFDDEQVDIATLVRRFNPEDGISALENPNTPKVVVGQNDAALYFSRSIIPFIRGKEREEWGKNHQFFTHIGMYAYRANVLNQITSLPQSSLEKAESLEQLRWLENGYRIKVGYSDEQTIGIDTPEDLQRAEQYLINNNL